jgi:hypothetical protein
LHSGLNRSDATSRRRIGQPHKHAHQRPAHRVAYLAVAGVAAVVAVSLGGAAAVGAAPAWRHHGHHGGDNFGWGLAAQPSRATVTSPAPSTAAPTSTSAAPTKTPTSASSTSRPAATSAASTHKAATTTASAPATAKPSTTSASRTPTTTPAPSTPAKTATTSAVAQSAGAVNTSGRNCGANPVACGYPGATTTGVPTGVTLTAVPAQATSGPGWTWNSGGWITVTGSGAVVSGLKISGHIEINASNVVVKNNDINQPGDNWGIALRSGSNVTIENNNIYATAATGANRLMVGIKDFGGSAGVKILANNIYHADTGIQIEQGLIQGNYIHDMGYNDGDHINGITSNGGTLAALTIDHNTILNSYGQTDAIGLFEDFGIQANRTISNKITGNRISTIYFPNGGSYGPLTADNTAGGGLISTNIWDATGLAALLG